MGIRKRRKVEATHLIQALGHLVTDDLYELLEDSFHIYIFLSRRLEEFQPELICQLASPLKRDDPLSFHITLVSHQNNLSIFPGICLDLSAPEIS